MSDVSIRHAHTLEDRRACLPVMQELRPHLRTHADFEARLQRMSAQQYRMLAAWQDGAVVAVAGYRLQENLIYGPFLYVDDLVTRADCRSHQHGARLLDELGRIAAQQGCAQLVLDTGLANALAQRFYFRQGLMTGALRFSKPIDTEAS